MLVRKLRFSKNELQDLIINLDGYAWVAVDIQRSIISVGDETSTQLRLGLFSQNSRLSDIFGVGVNLKTGEIYYRSPINRKSTDPLSTAEVPYEQRERIEEIIRYFFSELPAYQRKLPRYSRRPRLKFPHDEQC